jgi:predicted RNA-binding Zn-ribbon protein involved in translation (DUF1610 family)
MPINMACPSCGKTLAAPDTAAGKRAKCPACGQIMIVPELTQQGGDFGVPPTPSSPQPASSPTDSAPYDYDASGASSPVPPPACEEARRPCPECGEMIIASAIKCRFCNAIFDPRLKAQTKRHSAEDESLTAVDWVLCILCTCIGCIVGIVYTIQGKPKGIKMVGISIAAAVIWNVLNAFVQFATMPHGFR